MKKVFAIIIIISCCMNCPAQNVGINTTAPQAYGHGGINRVLELKNDAGTGADIQSHIILSTNGTSGSLGSLTWAAPNVTGAEKRTGLIANVFETANATRLAFYSRTETGSITEKFSINGNGNVGIGTTTPGFPLNFASTIGDKISLYGNTGNHYGFGVQGGLLQIHTDLAASNIAFGYGSSGSFNERMRILNNTGYDGMSLNGRLILKNGSADLVGGGAGVWLYKADNTGLLGFMGTQNNQNIGFYGGPGGWGFTYDAINSRVGIGNNNPNAPLAFPALLGKKITLFPGGLGNVGLGVYNNEFRIHTDYQPADITFGYENLAGVFTERFRFKGNGSFLVNGNGGSPGQLLKSNGDLSPEWVNNPVSEMYSLTEEIQSTGTLTLSSTPSQQEGDIPGLIKSLVLTKNSKVIVQFMIQCNAVVCAFCGNTDFDLRIKLNGGITGRIRKQVENNYSGLSVEGTRIFTLGPGTHEIKINAVNIAGPDINLAYPPTNSYASFMFIQVIPEK